MATKLTQIIANFSTSLSAKVAATDETATIVNYTDDDSVELPSGKYYFTIDGDNAQREHIYCSLSTANLTAIKSVSVQGAQTTGFARDHRVGASVTLTDHAIIREMVNLLSGEVALNADSPLAYDADPTLTDDKELATKKYVDEYALDVYGSAVHIEGNESVAGVKSFTSFPITPSSAPTTNYQVANKKYADDLAIAGSPDATIAIKGIGQYASAAQIIAGDETSTVDGTPLVVNPKYLKDAGITPYTAPTAKTLVPHSARNMYRTAGTLNIIGAGPTGGNTTMRAGQVIVPFEIDVNYITLSLNKDAGDGTFKFAIFSEDGQTRYVNESWDVDDGPTFALSSTPVTLSPGIYYEVLLGTLTGSPLLWTAWETYVGSTPADYLNGLSGFPGMEGSIEVTAETIPTTFDPTTLTAAERATPIMRLDN